jgi:hypothetical protein
MRRWGCSTSSEVHSLGRQLPGRLFANAKTVTTFPGNSHSLSFAASASPTPPDFSDRPGGLREAVVNHLVAMSTYPPAVVRWMLDYIDQHKGVDNLYEKDSTAALENLAKHVNTAFSYFRADRLTSSGIAGRLSKSANELAKDARLKGIRALFLYGSDILDLSRLENGT